MIKGAKAGQGKQRQAKVAADSAQSKTYIKILYGLSKGKIKGLARGNQSIYLDDTPLEGLNGEQNFQDVTIDLRLGTNDQDYIEGFPDISSEIAIGTELKSDTPWVKAFTNLDLDAVRVRLKWGPLREQNAKNGDVNGVTILYAIDVQTDGGTWTEALNTQISDKTSANYERTHRIDLPQADIGWQIRVRRITANSTSEYVSDKMYVEAVAEVIDAKLRYPNTALLGLQYDAETFSNVAKVAVECDGVEILVPSNYNPETRIYSGIWDGTFQRAYTNNPAWHFYDECLTIPRIDASMVDKWSIYRLGQYCDELVPDGKGGQEPRFTLNIYEQSQEDAWTVLSKMAGVFRAFIYWNGSQIVCDADVPQDTYFTYTRANVIDGNFEYSGTRARDRHSVANVKWDNPQNRYKTETLPVRDEKAISKIGVQIADISAWGSTSEGQSQRAGLWALKSEQFETRTVTFKVGLDGFIPLPGKVIEIADELFAGRANGGRIAAVSADLKQITLDRDDVVCRAGDRLVVNGESGKAQARIVQSIAGRIITVVAAFESVATQNVWVVDAQDLATMKFRVISITQDDDHQFTITGLQYNPLKYDVIDHGAFIDDRPISIVNPNIQAPVSNVVITSEDMVQQGLTVATMLITWNQAQGATKYLVEWRKDDGSWLKLPITGNNSVEVQGIYSGQYEAKVTAISAFNVASLPTYSVLTELSGKQGKPPQLASISAEGILFGIKLTWLFPAVGALDTAYTEIEVSPDGVSNIGQLGLFAYPTTVHTIQGMQPNLTQFYRGRLIDRIGNVGDWSNWVSGTTSADASAVLDILNGKITESQLHQDLQTKIDHIENIDTDISGLKTSVQQAKESAQKANDDLAIERTERIESINSTTTKINTEIQDRKTAISTLEDGLTKQIKAGDDAVLEVVDTVKKSSDQGLAAAQSSIKVVADELKLTAEKTDGVYAQLNPPLIGSTSDLIGNDQGFAGTWSLQSAMIEGDLALSKRVDTTVAQINDVQALAQQEVQARVDGDKANTVALNNYISSNNSTLSSVQQKAETAVTQSTANSSSIEALDSRVDVAESDASIAKTNAASALSKANTAVTDSSAAASMAQQANATATSAKSTADNALTNSATALSKADVAVTNASSAVSKVDAVEAKLGNYATTGALSAVDSKVADVDNKLTATTTKVDGVYAQVNPTLIGSETDLIGNSGGYAGVWSEQSARIEGDLSQSIRTDQVTAQMASNDAVYSQQIKATADALSANVTATNTLQTKVGQNTASIQEVTQSVNGLYIQKYIKLDVNGKVAGWGGANDGKESNFILNFDSFAIGSGGSTGYYPFIFRTTPFTDPVTGTVFPVSAYLKSAMMDYQSVKTSHIEDLSVKTAKIDNLAVTSGKIDNLAVTTLKIQDEAVSVPVGAKFADLSMNTATIRTNMTTPLPTDSEAQFQAWESAIGDLGSITMTRNGGKASISATLTVINLTTTNIALAVTNSGGTVSEAERRYVRMALSVYRNGTLVGRSYLAPTSVLGNSGVDVSGTLSVVSLVENSFVGTAVYTMKVGLAYMGSLTNVQIGVGGDTQIKFVGRSISVIELKK